MQLGEAVRRGPQWLSAKKLVFSDDRYNDIDPFVSRKGDRLYFTSNRPRPGASDSAARPDFDLWYALRTRSGWSQPIHAGQTVNSDLTEIFASEDRFGQLYFMRESKLGEAAIVMTARRRGSSFTDVRQVRINPDKIERLSNPAISADGRSLVMAGAIGDRGSLWISHRPRADEWSNFEPLQVATIGETATSFAPYLSNNGHMLYFTGECPIAGAPRGQRDIYAVAFTPHQP